MSPTQQYRLEILGCDSYRFVPIEEKTCEQKQKSAHNVTQITAPFFESNSNNNSNSQV